MGSGVLMPRPPAWIHPCLSTRVSRRSFTDQRSSYQVPIVTRFSDEHLNKVARRRLLLRSLTTRRIDPIELLRNWTERF